MKRVIILAAAMLASAVAYADTTSGVRAYNAGLYDVASTEFLREAQAGDADAQYRLGLMYADGVWFKPDRDEAMRWITAAAIQGHKAAVKKLEELSKGEKRKK